MSAVEALVDVAAGVLAPAVEVVEAPVVVLPRELVVKFGVVLVAVAVPEGVVAAPVDIGPGRAGSAFARVAVLLVMPGRELMPPPAGVPRAVADRAEASTRAEADTGDGSRLP